MLATLFRAIGLGSGSAVALGLHSFFWYTHMLVTFAFIASIPLSKFKHIFYTPINTFFRDLDPKGALVHRMIRAGVAHFVAHTNADSAAPGVSDALAERLGLRDVAMATPQIDDLVAMPKCGDGSADLTPFDEVALELAADFLETGSDLPLNGGHVGELSPPQRRLRLDSRRRLDSVARKNVEDALRSDGMAGKV
jgi:putative NIF3 family GTP cyclohydrolase 1 type 2